MTPARPALAALVLAWLGLAAAAPGHGQPLVPLAAEWGQYFAVESQAVVRDGRALSGGTVRNTSGWSARRIQLLVEAVDRDGRAVEQRVVWLGSDLPPGTHAHFEASLAAAPSAASYRVSVFAYDLGGTGGPR